MSIYPEGPQKGINGHGLPILKSKGRGPVRPEKEPGCFYDKPKETPQQDEPWERGGGVLSKLFLQKKG